MTRHVVAAVGSLLLTLFYLGVVAILSVQASGARMGVVFSIDGEVTGIQTPHVPWYFLIAAAAATALMFFLASSRHILLLEGVRRTVAVAMLVTLLAAVVAGVVTADPTVVVSGGMTGDPFPVGLDRWVQEWGTSVAVYVLVALLLLQLIRDRGGVETLPPYDDEVGATGQSRG